jgi:hypothetical protein
MPVGAASFSLQAETGHNSNQINISIHHINILPKYQHYGYCWRLLQEIIVHFPDLHSVLIFTPSNSWIKTKLVQMGFLAVVNYINQSSIPSSHVWLGLQLGDAECLQNLRYFLQNKATTAAAALQPQPQPQLQQLS